MMRLTWLGALYALLSATAFSELIEKPVTFENGLGSAVLYYDDNYDDKYDDKDDDKDDGGKQHKQPQAGVVVVHEWWGLNEYSRGRARQLAELGYPAIAVDMYGHGKVAKHASDAKSFMNAAFAEPEQMNARFEQARKALATVAKVPRDRQYAVGYCFGGAVVLGQARSGADLAGVASFHGSLGTKTPAQPGTINARVLVATGGADPMVPPEQVGQFVQEMSSAGAKLELLSFPGAKHSFTNPDADAAGAANALPLAYDPQADAESWAALLRFIGQADAAQ